MIQKLPQAAPAWAVMLNWHKVGEISGRREGRGGKRPGKCAWLEKSELQVSMCSG